MKYEILIDIYSTTLKQSFKKGDEVDAPKKLGDAWERLGHAKKIQPPKSDKK